MTISCQLHGSAAFPWASGINTRVTLQTLRRTEKSFALAGNQSKPRLHNLCSVSSNQGLSPQMKTEWFSTTTAIAISKKEAFTGSFRAKELLELCRPLTKERNNGLGSQSPSPQQERAIAQCWPAILWAFSAVIQEKGQILASCINLTNYTFHTCKLLQICVWWLQ
jgi:hypothetical protein